jgi:hypothetical protein
VTEPTLNPQLAARAEALCLLLDSADELRDMPQVLEAAMRAKSLFVPGTDAGQLAAAFDEVDEALRRAGDARGLRGHSRSLPVPASDHAGSATPPGLTRQLKAAVCPGPVRCSRIEPARDLWPATCAISGLRMRKERLRPGS